MDNEKSLVDCFKKTINAKFHLASSPQSIVVKEGQTNTLTLLKQVKDINCFGFIAETGVPEPLALLVNQPTGLSGVRKMCDGIVVFSQGKKNYILAVELKGYQTNEAHKQIGNARILCEWLINLFKEHGHWDGDHQFCGIINRNERKIKRKGTSNHYPLKVKKHNKYPFIHGRHTEIRLNQIANRINQST